MSSALAISGVTGVLQSMLHNVYTSSTLGSVSVSAVAPDIVQSSVGTSAEAQLQVNLFLHQVTPNAAWRNMGLPSLAADGSTRQQNPPLALDLHYLLTVYAGTDGKAEGLLGYAIQMLHDYPVLSRNQISTYLAGLAATDPLRTSGLADQIELIKITPATLGREELAWIWTALKADYRPTFPFQVSVVLIQSQYPAVSALPVLRHSVAARPDILSPLPTITGVAPPGGQPAAALGDNVTVNGQNLLGATAVVLTSSRLGIPQTVTGLSSVGNSSFQFTVPNPALPPPQTNPTDLPAGLYLLSAQVPVGTSTVSTNGLPLAIAPKITSLSPASLTSGTTPQTLTVSCTPYLRPQQQVSLLIGGQETIATAFTAPTNSPSFTFQSLQKTGVPVPVRLRVDGVDSSIIDMTKTPPVFLGPPTVIQVN
jgi:Pvc16 N-terminal domain